MNREQLVAELEMIRKDPKGPPIDNLEKHLSDELSRRNAVAGASGTIVKKFAKNNDPKTNAPYAATVEMSSRRFEAVDQELKEAKVKGNAKSTMTKTTEANRVICTGIIRDGEGYLTKRLIAFKEMTPGGVFRCTVKYDSATQLCWTSPFTYTDFSAASRMGFSDYNFPKGGYTGTLLLSSYIVVPKNEVPSERLKIDHGQVLDYNTLQLSEIKKKESSVEGRDDHTRSNTTKGSTTGKPQMKTSSSETRLIGLGSNSYSLSQAVASSSSSAGAAVAAGDGETCSGAAAAATSSLSSSFSSFSFLAVVKISSPSHNDEEVKDEFDIRGYHERGALSAERKILYLSLSLPLSHSSSFLTLLFFFTNSSTSSSSPEATDCEKEEKRVKASSDRTSSSSSGSEGEGRGGEKRRLSTEDSLPESMTMNPLNALNTVNELLGGNCSKREIMSALRDSAWDTNLAINALLSGGTNGDFPSPPAKKSTLSPAERVATAMAATTKKAETTRKAVTTTSNKPKKHSDDGGSDAATTKKRKKRSTSCLKEGEVGVLSAAADHDDCGGKGEEQKKQKKKKQRNEKKTTPAMATNEDSREEEMEYDRSEKKACPEKEVIIIDDSE
jgi:hypothetical protein